VSLLITGGGSGIGLATARRAAETGTDVGVLDLDVSAWPGFGVEADIADPGAVRAAADAVAERLGPVTALVTCAGVVERAALRDTDPDRLRHVFDVNVFGTVYAMQAVVDSMRAAGGGQIVTVSSVAAHRGGGLLGGAAYAASKAGVIGLTRAAARELAPDGIRVNSVAPGPVATPVLGESAGRFAEATLLRRVARPEEIADAVLFLLGPGSADITGETLNVNGGAHFS
jgi:NAD(P)-dependent dehydrogenase (short-subunit alcohol dehydrogenase family)